MRLFALVFAGIFLPGCPLSLLPSGNEDAVSLKTDSEIFAGGMMASSRFKNLENGEEIVLSSTNRTLASSGKLFAGFSKVDMTPPPFIGMAGYGPDGRKSMGHRLRLNSKAMVLKKDKKIFSMVTVDLCGVSQIVKRKVSEKVYSKTGIKPSEIFISATHTHSGPGQLFDGEMLNTQGSAVPGFDPVLVEFVSNQVAESIIGAFSDLKPAKAAWKTKNVWGITRNRSEGAHDKNNFERLGNQDFLAKSTYLPGKYRKIDPRMSILRVDQWDENEKNFSPKGSVIVFGIHGTMVTAANDLYDSDIQGMVQRIVETRMGKDSVALFANGSSGDISGDWSGESRCRSEKCLASSLKDVIRVSESLGNAAVEIFSSIDSEKEMNPEFDFNSYSKLEKLQFNEENALCSRARIGSSSLGGAEDWRTVYYHFTPIPGVNLTSLGFEEGGSAIDKNSLNCHSPKRVIGESAQKYFVDPAGFPIYGEFGVIDFEGLTLATVPTEATIGAQNIIMSKLSPGYASGVMGEAGKEKRVFRLLTMTNGYNHYVTSEAEYKEQHYEGAMTVYGPRSAEVFGNYLYKTRFNNVRTLAADVSENIEMNILPGRRTVIFPRTQFIKRLPKNSRKLTEIKKSDTCNKNDDNPFTSSKIEVLWKDAAPGWLNPSDGEIVQIERKNNKGDWEKVAWDDDLFMEVRTLGKIKNSSNPVGAHLWKATWSFAGKEKWWASRKFLHRVVIPKRNSYPELVSDTFQLCSI